MSEVALEQPATKPAVTLKGNLFTLTVVYLNVSTLSQIDEQLKTLIASTPKFFEHAPVILDCSGLTSSERLSLDFSALKALLKQYRLILVGIRAQEEPFNHLVLTHELALLPPSRTKYEESYGYRVKQAQKAKEEAQTAAAQRMESSQQSQDTLAVESSSCTHSAETPEKQKHTPATVATKVINEPVRSGQQIYARGGDLIVLSSVSHGAEILADGNIHVYGTLSGRALAGVQGNADCHIFCRKLDAELVAIAGHYRVKEDIGTPPEGFMLDISLQSEKIKIEPM